LKYRYINAHNDVIQTFVSQNKGEKPMSKTQREYQTYASAAQLNPLLVAADAAIKHPPAELKLETPTRLTDGIHFPKRTCEKQKQPLKFCPTCQMLLHATARPLALRCKKCGYKAILEQAIVVDAKQTHRHTSEIAVIDKEKASLRTHPIVQAFCERCGKTESETWAIEVGSEGAVSSWVFLKCTHCGFIRREMG
jgi:DNA-directed RNA polymerase subunit M/transcription elongation factor TFIIS